MVKASHLRARGLHPLHPRQNIILDRARLDQYMALSPRRSFARTVNPPHRPQQPPQRHQEVALCSAREIKAAAHVTRGTTVLA